MPFNQNYFYNLNIDFENKRRTKPFP